MYKADYLLMTPGPTMVRGNVMHARSKPFGGPDLDPNFFFFYDELCKKTGKFFGVEDSKVIIMNGEGMLGLDSVCASLTEKGDRVLVISNGIFGEGFKELITPYGGEVVLFESSPFKSVDIEELAAFLRKDSDFKYATVVHCDTPTGVLNDVKAICSLLKSYEIITVVDTVAAVGGVELKVDEWEIDFALGASQKVFSAPSGLTVMTISPLGWETMKKRTTPIQSFYCNLLLWENCIENRMFPYTMPASDLLGFNTAIDNLLSETVERVWDRHEEMREYTIERLKQMGIDLFLESGFSPTVTAFETPKGYEAMEIINHMREKYDVLIAGSYGKFAGKVLRIGHMGENARFDRVIFTLDILEKTLADLKK